MASAPNPQLSPIDIGSPNDMEAIIASRVCPERVRPDSVSVTDSIKGTLTPTISMALRAAHIAALALRPSYIVSMSRASTPPSINAFICSIYVSVNRSQSTTPAEGSSIPCPIVSDLLVGPTLPATQRIAPGCCVMYSSAASRAIFAAA